MDRTTEPEFTPVASQCVAPKRVSECPVRMEGIVHHHRPFGKNVIVKLHVDEDLLTGDSSRPHIDPERWPLIMRFCRIVGMGREVHLSRLAASAFMKAVRRSAAS